MSINEAATIQTTSINAVTPTTGTLSVGNTQTTGVMNVGTGVRTSAGVMNIATGASNACAINIMNGNTTAGSVNIANGTGASQTTAVNISSGSTTGTVTIGNTGNTTTLASGTTNIATAVGLTSSINILNGGGATTGGSVNIANGTSQTTTVNIASGTGTGAVTIGNTGNTTNLNSGITNIRGTLGVTGTIAATGMITANGGLTMGGSNNITLSSTPGSFSATQLGFIIANDIGFTSTGLPASGTSISSFQITVQGVYMFVWSVQLNASSYPQFYTNLNTGATLGTLTSQISPNIGYSTIIGNAFINSGASFPFVVDSTNVNKFFSLALFYTASGYGGGNCITGKYSVIRIA